MCTGTVQRNEATEWRVSALSSAYGALYAMGPRDALTVTFDREGITLSCVTWADERIRQIRDYPGTQLGHDYYQLLLAEAERRAILTAFCPYSALDRSWIEEGEPEQWRLELKNPEGCVAITIHLCLRS